MPGPLPGLARLAGRGAREGVRGAALASLCAFLSAAGLLCFVDWPFGALPDDPLFAALPDGFGLGVPPADAASFGLGVTAVCFTGDCLLAWSSIGFSSAISYLRAPWACAGRSNDNAQPAS